MRELIKNKKNVVVVSVVSIVVILLFVIFNVINNKNDGMENTKQVSIYYKTYTKNNKWSKFSKNALTSGDFKNPIQNISIKTKSRTKGYVMYSVYSNGKWIKDLDSESKIKNANISAVRFFNIDELNKKYDICYRTYNKKDKWLNWSCEGDINGNKNENITAIEIKIIPRNVTKYEWLKDFNKTVDSSSIGF